ncbi:alpha/beta hydrolase family protein [Paraburkholderia acidisoli]|uniref:Prolyl oligopeptidase family serine peptidase n=1 Tax=Paraburkholderia acidisoli TaxID=2571748 RepID=A0A7Z2JIX4_9BURK|nr:S9 family peptidase [Paraburkholderia acidisoli]QGZ64794.1 prolyl oligopeptidase family serine peptidase [Paraburkholderia acidisoli]
MTDLHASSAHAASPPQNARITADQAVAAGKDYAELAASERGVFWTQFDPADSATRIFHVPSGEPGAAPRCLTPDGFSVRGRVYEYGGGAFCVAGDTLVFVNEKDQRLYRQAIDGDTHAPLALTPAGRRYGDLRAHRDHVLAVEEDGDTHRIVAIALEDGAREVLAEGGDFYAAPCLHETREGTARLVWIEWQRPHQPWTSTQLRERVRDARGAWSSPRTLAGGDRIEALQQPQFDAHGALWCLTDRAGYWQPWRVRDDTLEALPCAAADHASAPWQLGARSWLALDEGASFATWFDDGFGVLAHRLNDGTHAIASAYSRFHHLAADATHFYCLAASPTCPAAVLAIARDDRRVEVLSEVSPMLPAARIPQPESLRFPSGDSHAYGYFYAPQAAADTTGNATPAPPVVVFVHGGPTSACYPVFDPRMAYWTQRGFAVVNLNYRGSTGYGREFREALHDNWGVADVDDACNAVAWLAAQGRVDATRAFVRGGSAGGYTVLCALAFREVFRGGASLYGVSDPLTLGAHTHKFEADYLDWLIGDPVAQADRYRARTPLLHADRIDAPVIFFQGELDAVVTPDQTRRMVSALEARGVKVEAHYYADERHGFRKAANQAHALEAEYRFYCAVLGQPA